MTERNPENNTIYPLGLTFDARVGNHYLMFDTRHREDKPVQVAIAICGGKKKVCFYAPKYIAIADADKLFQESSLIHEKLRRGLPLTSGDIVIINGIGKTHQNKTDPLGDSDISDRFQ